jgi:MFS family permease
MFCCDIIILVILCRSIAAQANSKGRNAVGYVLMLIALYLGGGVFGAFCAGMIVAIAGGNDSDESLQMFGLVGAIAGMVIGAVVSFTIVGSLSDLRDDYQLRERDRDRSPGDRPWGADDYRKHFGLGEYRQENPSDRPRPRPENEDDRYRTE